MFSSQIHSSDPKPRFWVQEDVKVWRWSTFNRLFSCFHQDFLIHSRCWGCWFVTWGALHSELSELFVFLTFQDFFEGLWQLRLSFFPLVLKSQVPAHSNVKGKFQWFQCKQTWGSTSKKIRQVKKEVVFVFFFFFFLLQTSINSLYVKYCVLHSAVLETPSTDLKHQLFSHVILALIDKTTFAGSIWAV